MAAATDSFTESDGAQPFTDLVAELADFQRGVSRPGRLSLVGTHAPGQRRIRACARYRDKVVAPRRKRKRLRLILEQAQLLGMIDADADLQVAVTMCTGSWYGRALAGSQPPQDWPHRTVSALTESRAFC